MTFLNPFLLLGLAAAALPLLIHLLNLRRLQTIEFSSLRFIKELQQTRIRRLKIRQVLLLIVRTLLVVFLVLAFSRPALEGNLAGPIGTNARSTLVILLDDSPSMGVRTERGMKFTEGLDAARQIVGLANPGDEVVLLLLSETRSAETASVDLEEILSNIQPSHITVPFREAMDRVRSILAESRNINKEIYLISDLQASQFKDSETDTTLRFSDEVRLFVREIPGPAGPRNLGITSVTASAQVITPGRPMNHQARVTNGGTTLEENTVLSVYTDGTRTAQQSVNLPEGGSGSYIFTLLPKDPGFILGTVELEDDLLELDNRRYFTVEVPARINVGIIGTTEDTRYLRLAISAEKGLSAQEFLVPVQIDESAIGSTNLARFDILLLVNVADLTAQEGDRLIRFVTSGGGLALFPGPQTDIASISTHLLLGLGIPAFSGTASLEGDGGISFARTDLAHPLFAGLFEQGMATRDREIDIESPRIKTHVRTSAGVRGNVVVGLSDGSPFLVEHVAGSGRVLVFTSGLDLAWSDFPLKGVFAPLLHRGSVYLATGHEQQDETIVGMPVTFRVNNVTGQESYSMRTPDNLRERLRPELNPVTGTTDFISPPSRRAGFYELTRDGVEGSLLGVVAVNPDPGESIFRAVDEETIRNFFSSSGIGQEQITFVRDPGEIGPVVVESRYGVELWRVMLGAAVFLALCEMAIARVGRREEMTTKGNTR